MQPAGLGLAMVLEANPNQVVLVVADSEEAHLAGSEGANPMDLEVAHPMDLEIHPVDSVDPKVNIRCSFFNSLVFHDSMSD